MRASDFEEDHPMLLHLLIAGAGWATYLWDREDVVWRLIRDSPSRRGLEHVVFACATVLIGVGAILCTRWQTQPAAALNANNVTPAGLFGQWLYALGLATLLPLGGSMLLVAGESIRIVRLGLSRRTLARLPGRDPDSKRKAARWSVAVRREFVKWGVLVTMVVFSICLVDRVADYGIAASVVAWGAVNARRGRVEGREP